MSIGAVLYLSQGIMILKDSGSVSFGSPKRLLLRPALTRLLSRNIFHPFKRYLS